jgi:hypothetical protein
MWYIRLKILSRKLFNNMTNSIHLDGSSLSIEQVIRVAYERTPVELTPASVKKVERAAQAVQDLLARGEIAYGVTTGFGAFKDRIISADQVETLQRNIIVSHAVGVGDLFDIPTTRAIMLIRANTLAHGHSGIRPPRSICCWRCSTVASIPASPKKVRSAPAAIWLPWRTWRW